MKGKTKKMGKIRDLFIDFAYPVIILIILLHMMMGNKIEENKEHIKVIMEYIILQEEIKQLRE